jgi:predicted nucleic acid-binding protein
MGLMDDLGSRQVGIDTSIFIYFIEAAPVWLPLITPLFRAADNGQLELVTSSTTVLEVLVVPYRANNEALAARYEALLTGSRGIRLIDVTRDQLRQAARLRASMSVRTPDALQISAAQEAGCSVFLTNDRRLPSVPGLRVLQLASYANSPKD